MKITPLTMIASLRLLSKTGPDDRSAYQIARALDLPHVSQIADALSRATEWGWLDHCAQTRTYTMTARGLDRLHQAMRSETVIAAARAKRNPPATPVAYDPSDQVKIQEKTKQRRDQIMRMLYCNGKMCAREIASEVCEKTGAVRRFSFGCLNRDCKAGNIIVRREPMPNSIGIVVIQGTYELTRRGRNLMQEEMKVKA